MPRIDWSAVDAAVAAAVVARSIGNERPRPSGVPGCAGASEVLDERAEAFLPRTVVVVVMVVAVVVVAVVVVAAVATVADVAVAGWGLDDVEDGPSASEMFRVARSTVSRNEMAASKLVRQ